MIGKCVGILPVIEVTRKEQKNVYDKGDYEKRLAMGITAT